MKLNKKWPPSSGLLWCLSGITVALMQWMIFPNLDDYYASILSYAGINIVLAVSLNLVNGFTGQFSMGHAGFMSVGAYVAAWITTSLQSTRPELLSGAASPLVFASSLLIGGVVAAVVGYGVGLPSLRLKGDYLAIVTLGFGEIIRVLILNVDAVGGARGLPNIPGLANLGWIYETVLLTTFTLWRVTRSPLGRSFLAVREDETAAEAMGVNTTQAKVRAFVIGAFFAGMAGGLFAHTLRYINPQTFDFNRSVEIIIMVVLGGTGSISGSIVAALFLSCIREILRPLQEWTHLDFRMIIYSLLLIILMLVRPKGLFGTRELPEIWNQFWQKKRGLLPQETLLKKQPQQHELTRP
jgi:branched-chain amino acid transport system permease protein